MNIFTKRLHTVIFCSVLLSQMLPGQICDKKATIYFGTNESSIPATENQKLGKLASVFAQKTDTFMVEIHAFSDSIASAEYNYKLASKRLKSIADYLKKYAFAHFEITEKVRGEALPIGSNATEEGRAKNRRVDVFYWKLKSGRIALKGRGGMEIEVERSYFGTCGVCESNPKLTEVFSNEEAERRGIPMTTTDGDELITGGMINLDFSCNDAKKAGPDLPCRDVVIRIPAAFDEDLELWKSTNDKTRSAMRWYQDYGGDLEYDYKNKCYVIRTNYCPGRTMINLDKRRPAMIAGRLIQDTTGLIAIPEINRSNKGTYVRADKPGLIYSRGRALNSMWQFKYRKKGSVFFADSGVGKNKIGYVFSGIIDRFEAECDTVNCRTLKQCWCFEIPIDNYTKIIYFQKKKNYRLKVPRKYRNYDLRLFIPAADTMLTFTKVPGSKRKYDFKMPVPDTYVVFYGDKGNLSDKRGYDAHIDVAEIRAKYSRRHNHYKAKIKRKQLKKMLSPKT